MLTPELRLGILGASLIHGIAFLGIPGTAAVRYDVIHAPSGLEVSLIASAPVKKESGRSVKREVLIPEKKIPPSEKIPVNKKQRSSKKTKQEPQNEILPNASQGASYEAKALEFQNHPPVYPRLARDRGYEGTVTLRVWVGVDGQVQNVVVLTSSGYDILDHSALDSIRRWQFEPAKVFGIAKASTIDIPVLFFLKDTK